MKFCLRFCLVLSAVFALANASWADRGTPPPVQPPANTLPLTIKIDPNAKTAILELPATLLGEQPAAEKTSQAPDRRRTMIAGVALSLAAASLVWTRRRPRAKQAAALVLVAGVLASSAVHYATADIAIPPNNAPARGPAQTVTVRMIPDATGVTLILPKNHHIEGAAPRPNRR